VDSPQAAFVEIRRVTKPGGLITILIPTDPGLAYRAVRSLTTVKSARRLGLADHVNLMHARAHHNHFWSLEKQLRSAYADDLISDRFWPLGIKSWNANLLTVWSIRVNKA
jgi:SAM-dependent methyltransferase